MLYTLILTVHVIVVVLLVMVILIQRGRGSGLIEAVSSAESLFGTKTSSLLVKSTAVLAVLFFVTSMSLTFLSKKRSGSLTDRYKKILETPIEPVPVQGTAPAPKTPPAPAQSVPIQKESPAVPTSPPPAK